MKEKPEYNAELLKWAKEDEAELVKELDSVLVWNKPFWRTEPILKYRASEYPNHSPVFNEVIFEDLVSVGARRGEAGLHECSKALHTLTWRHAEVQRIT